MARQYTIGGLPFPVDVSETGTRQENIAGIDLSEAAAAVDATAVTAASITITAGTVGVTDTIPVTAASVSVTAGTIGVADTIPVTRASVSVSGGTVGVTDSIPVAAAAISVSGGTIGVTDTIPITAAAIAISGGTITDIDTGTVVDETHTQGGHGKKRLRPGRHANADDYDRPYLAEYREELERFVEAKEAAKRAREAAEQRKSKVVAKQARIVAELARPEADDDTDWDSLLSAATELSKSTRLQAEKVIALSDALLARAERLEMEARQRLINEERRSTIDRARTYELKLLLDDEEAIAFLLAA